MLVNEALCVLFLFGSYVSVENKNLWHLFLNMKEKKFICCFLFCLPSPNLRGQDLEFQARNLVRKSNPLTKNPTQTETVLI